MLFAQEVNVANTLMAIVFGIAVVLTLLSAWMYASYGYHAIIGLFAAGFAIDVVSNFFTHGAWDLRTMSIDACVFGFLLYFVTVQTVTRRKVSSVVSGREYKAFLVENQKYYGFYKFVCYLPIILIVGGVCIAVYWKFLSA
jgi:hypothetical protein